MGTPANGADTPIRDALLRHARAELAVDVEAVMVTVAAHPDWLIHPLWRITGREAVTETYRRALPSSGHSDLSAETMRAFDDPRVTTWAASMCAVEYSLVPDEYPLHDGLTLTYHFEGDLVVSERVYLSRTDVVDRIFAFYGEDFGDFPGVTRLS